MRLVGGFGTLCDPLHSGIVEVYHFGEWGALCFDGRKDDRLVADVVCRQLGFPHGTPVDPTEAEEINDYDDYRFFFTALAPEAVEESQRPQERFWLSAATCRGPEERLVDCDLGPGFRTANRGCTATGVTRFQAACRQFAVSAALEDVTTPGAGTNVLSRCMHASECLQHAKPSSNCPDRDLVGSCINLNAAVQLDRMIHLFLHLSMQVTLSTRNLHENDSELHGAM